VKQEVSWKPHAPLGAKKGGKKIGCWIYMDMIQSCDYECHIFWDEMTYSMVEIRRHFEKYIASIFRIE
jgi:hypothetical protein